MKQVVLLLAVLALAPTAAAQTADDYRGGWRTDSGEAHTYEFSIRGTTVRGIYCTYCADATTLAFVDGTLGPDGITFEVTHVNADGSTAYKDKAVGEVQPRPPDRDRHERRARRRQFERVLSRIRVDRIRSRPRCRCSRRTARRCRATSRVATLTAPTACPTSCRVRGSRR